MNRFLLAAPLFFAVCLSAPAQKYEVSVSKGIFRPTDAVLGSFYEESPKDDDTRFVSGSPASLGARITLNTPGYYGHEVSYTRSRPALRIRVRPATGGPVLRDVKINTYIASYNFLMYFMPAGERIRPFMTGGAQMQYYGNVDIPESYGSSRHYGVNYGLGLKFMLFKHGLLRVDFRDFFGGKPYDLRFEEITRTGGIVRHMEFSVGFSLAF